MTRPRHAVLPAVLPAIALALAACGADEPPDTRVPCASQAACGDAYLSFCEQGYCTPPLPDVAAVRVLDLDVNYQVRLKQLQAARVTVVYANTPDGKRVTCPGKAAGPGDVAIPSMAALFDRAKFNLAWNIMKFDFTKSTTGMPVRINGPGRLVYVELYEEIPKENEPASGGPPVGVGCLADAPYLASADASSPPIPFVIERPPQ
jgi:hypothetical protein